MNIVLIGPQKWSSSLLNQTPGRKKGQKMYVTNNQYNIQVFIIPANKQYVLAAMCISF